ncbi:MAG TPA: tetratricopeptide repeat protein, partial [Alphaproteobacteria bacterium]
MHLSKRATTLCAAAWLALGGCTDTAPHDLAAGEAAIARDDPAEAIKMFERVIDARDQPPNTRAVAYVGRGVTYQNEGRYDEALADYDRAIGLMPTLAEAYVNRASIYVIKGQYERGLADYDRALALKP